MLRFLASVALALACVAWAPTPQVYPPELPPRQPTVQLLFMTLPAPPQLDLPAAPAGEPITQMLLCPANVYTDQTECSTYAQQGQDAANAVYAADPANPTRVRVIGVFLATYNSINSMSTELTQIQANTLPGVNVAALRDQYRADRVTLINNDTSNCGLGYMSASVYGKVYGFSVVNKSCGIGNSSLWHEWGHNDGLCHDTPNASGCTPAKPNGFGLCDSAHGRRSPMTYPSPCGGSRTIFSNPANTWTYGYPFGDATHDEASVQRWAMPIEANFYPPLGLPAPVNHAR